MRRLAISILVLVIGMLGSAIAAPVELWTELGPDQINSNKNIYYGGGVYNGTFYTGQLNYGPLAYASVQTDGTAKVNGYDLQTTAGSKSSVPIGDYIYWSSNNGATAISRLDSDWNNNVGPVNPGSNPEGLATDGTALFTNSDTARNVIYKYSITNSTSSFSLDQLFATTITDAARFRALSYYDGMIYVADVGTGSDTGKGIYEIDASTGAYTKLGTHIGYGAYQVARYNDELLVVGLDSNLTIYDFTGGVLGAGKAYNLNQGQLYGIGVVGNGTDVTGFWVTSATGEISHFAVPEPSSILALAGGLGCLFPLIRRRK
jgi:hypothetical protein